MAFHLQAFDDIGLTAELLAILLDDHERATLPRLSRLWAYYRNPMRHTGSAECASPVARPYRLGQEAGLPPRLRGSSSSLADDRSRTTEVVIENDIAWRIDAMVDFAFGKPVTILSTARDPKLRAVIERVLDAVWESSGGIALLQDMSLLGAVYGFVDLIVRTEELSGGSPQRADAGAPPTTPEALDEIVGLAERLRIELVEAPRAIPILDPGDYRRIVGYIIRSRQIKNEVNSARPSFRGGSRNSESSVARGAKGGGVGSFAARLATWLSARRAGAALPPGLPGFPGASDEPASGRTVREVIEVLSASRRHVYEDGILLVDEPGTLGVMPLVHVQNASQPFTYSGISDVEPLIPLQDELNTRLSDRAHRVTLQSFNMYLAKGLEGFGGMGVGPGQVWSTDNPDASIQSFGGDSHAPSESDHIEQVRDAMDKLSAVSPVALGVIRAKLGHLSSENALRITLNGVLSKTARKRVSYGRAIAQVCRIVLLALDRAGILKTSDTDRGIRLHWQDPLPLDERARLNAALLKRDLGVPTHELLAEIGYARVDAGVG